MTKEELKDTVHKYSDYVGGIDNFLELLTSIKEQKANILLDKEANFKHKNTNINWKKSIYKETLTALFSAIKREDKNNDMLNGIDPKEYKHTMNMMKIVKPIEIVITIAEDKSFSFTILDTSIPKKTKINSIFKIMFFYNIGVIKQALDIDLPND